MDNRFIIDWLSFTIPVRNERDLQAFRVKQIVREIGLDFDYELRERGRFGYTRSFVFSDCITVLFNDYDMFEFASYERQEQISEMGIHIEISGQGCRYVESKINEDWRGFLHGLNLRNVKYSRLDIALDDYKETLNFNVIERKVKSGEVISTSKKRNVEESYLQVHKQEKFDNKGESKGKTIYFGTRGSSVYIRFTIRKRNKKIKVLK